MDNSRPTNNQNVRPTSLPVPSSADRKHGLTALSNPTMSDHPERKKGTTLPSPTSPQKIGANRRNAQKSTGPRTARGKAAVRFNALKHGFLSKQVVISSKHIQESTNDFQDLVAECWDYFQPVGRPEDLLVEQIAVCLWNSRRAIRCELGEIEKSVDLDEEQLLAKLGDQSLFMIALQLWILETAKREIEMHGTLSERTKANIEKDFGRFQISSPEYLVCPDSDVEGWKKRLLECIEGMFALWESSYKAAERCEAREAKLRRERLALPRAEALDRIMRYQAANERRLHRSLAELERLQRQRKGEYVPPPLRVAVDGSERG